VPRGGRRGAFALVELAVWLGILASLSWIGARMFQGMSVEFRVRRAAREVAALLEWARWEAVMRGEALTVAFDPGEGEISVAPEGEAPGGEGEPAAPLRRLALHARHPGVVFGAARGVARTSGCDEVEPEGVHLRDRLVRFLPTGSADRSGSLYWVPSEDLPDHGGRMMALSILLATGRIQLWRFDTWAESECSEQGGWVPVY